MHSRPQAGDLTQPRLLWVFAGYQGNFLPGMLAVCPLRPAIAARIVRFCGRTKWGRGRRARRNPATFLAARLLREACTRLSKL